MKRQDFYYELPLELIAKYPAIPRHSARLLHYHRLNQTITHASQVLDIVNYFEPGDLLVSNDTKVLPARFFGKKVTGGQVEVLMERLLTHDEMLCHMRSAPKPGGIVLLDGGYSLEVIGREHDLFHVKVNGNIVDILKEIGHMPLPPYIDRPDESSDQQNYQTIFAQHEGSVAAPTAGLHFDDILLNKLAEKGIEMATVTLHVGAGTFQPVRVDDIKDHVMHYEWYSITDELIAKIKSAKRVIAIGTTSLRAIESAARDDFKTKTGLTNLFITPGYEFKVIDGLMTNFHLPESTLLMLVSALIGHAELMRVYEEAVKAHYRFFSYGDACLFL
jgi:S-adenosylmethionine:tRNA ribosyltransferase-isomerase